MLALNAAVFVYQLSLGAAARGLVERHGFVPAELGAALDGGESGALLLAAQAVLTSMFLHGGWLHVIGNLLYLRVFGDNVEDRFGAVWYLGFYVLAGAAGALGHYLSDPSSPVPTIGASGAIAGVLGAYIVLFPTARVVTLFPVFIFLTFIEVPALVFLGIWGAQQLLYGFASIEGGEAAQSVAWFAHVGGFAFGLFTGTAYRIVRRGGPKRRR